MKWPEKRLMHRKYCSWGIGTSGCNCGMDTWNACLEACKATYEKYKIHACKCNDEGGARTLRQLDEGLCQCPRCGGIVVFRKEAKIDQKELTQFLETCGIYRPQDLANDICERFGGGE